MARKKKRTKRSSVEVDLYVTPHEYTPEEQAETSEWIRQNKLLNAAQKFPPQ